MYQNGTGNGSGSVYLDDAGKKILPSYTSQNLGNRSANPTIYDAGCLLVALTRIANRAGARVYDPGEVNKIAVEQGLMTKDGELTIESATKLLAILTNKEVSSTSVSGTEEGLKGIIKGYAAQKEGVYLVGKLELGDFKHYVNINGYTDEKPVVADTSTKNRTWDAKKETLSSVWVFSFKE